MSSTTASLVGAFGSDTWDARFAELERPHCSFTGERWAHALVKKEELQRLLSAGQARLEADARELTKSPTTTG